MDEICEAYTRRIVRTVFERAVRAAAVPSGPSTPVLVNLDALSLPVDSAAAVRSQPSGDDRLNLSRWAVGTLHRWLRSGIGHWIGVCTILISRNGSTYRAVDQLVPARALRQRAR